MAKTTHTHTGTCQACGAVQAVDNQTQRIAKHGYKVAGFGMFVGTCSGSDKPPAELDLTHTRLIILNCHAWADNADRLEALWTSGALMVTTQTVAGPKRDVRGFRIYHEVMMFGCADYSIAAVRRKHASDHERQAESARAHAYSLDKHVIPRFGKPLYAAAVKKAPRNFIAGERVTLYGVAFIVKEQLTGYRAMYVRGYYETNPDRIFTPSLRTLRGQNP